MKKCKNCGFENTDESRFCSACGAAIAVDPFAPAHDSAEDVFEQTRITPVPSAADTAKPQQERAGFKTKAVELKNKTVEFEKQHNLILNVIIAVCAVIVAFVALFAPVKTVAYIPVFGEDLFIEDLDKEDSEVIYSYVEFDQSIWQMLYSLKYINAGEKDQYLLQLQVQAASRRAANDYAAWISSNPHADEEERSQAIADIYAAHMSEIDYLGLIIANGVKTAGISESVVVSAMISMAIGVIVAALAIAMSVISIVNIVFAIINAVHKKPAKSIYKYFSALLGISGAGLLLLFLSPMLKAGGGMFAVALFAAIMNMICGSAGAIVSGKAGLPEVIKRAIVALLVTIAFFLLCSDVLREYKIKKVGFDAINVTTGYALVLFLRGVMHMSVSDAFFIHGTLAAVFYVMLALIAIPCALDCMIRAVRRLEFGEKEKPFAARAVAAAVLMIITAIFGLAFSATFADKLVESLDAKLLYDTKWTVNAQVWASSALLLTAVIFNAAFRPNKKPIGPAPATEPIAA